MMQQLSTVLKKYEKINDNTYKILLSFYHSGRPEQTSSFTEKDFRDKIESSIFDDKARVIPSSLTNYYGLHGNYKTCLVQATKSVIPASTASFASTVEGKGFKKVSANVFVDGQTNKIWKKVVSDTGTVQLVQTQEENLEDLMRNRMDVSVAVAFSRPLYALNCEQFDYVYFYNANSQKVESGVVLGETEEGQKVISSRQQLDSVRVSPHCVVLCAGVQELKEMLDRDLKNAKTAEDVMKTYINAWFKSLDGADYADKTEKILKSELLQAQASTLASDDSDSDDMSDMNNESAQDSAENPELTKDELESVVCNRFDKSRTASFAFAESLGNRQHNLKFTKPMEIDDVVYVQSKIKEIFKTTAELNTSSEFVNFKISL